MEKQKEDGSELLVKVTGQGFSISIHGKKEVDGSWACGVESSEIIFADVPDNDFIHRLEQERHYGMTGFDFNFEQAFRRFDESEWFLCRPQIIHRDVADAILKEFEIRMDAYDDHYPVDSPMEAFIRKNRRNDWREKARG